MPQEFCWCLALYKILGTTRRLYLKCGCLYCDLIQSSGINVNILAGSSVVLLDESCCAQRTLLTIPQTQKVKWQRRLRGSPGFHLLVPEEEYFHLTLTLHWITGFSFYGLSPKFPLTVQVWFLIYQVYLFIVGKRWLVITLASSLN